MDMERHFTVAIFIVHKGRTLLHLHMKLGRWLPVGGHVDAKESLCEAAIREAKEESGLNIRLMGHRPMIAPMNEHLHELIPPLYMQNERIGPDHEHIDAIFYATSDSADLTPDHHEASIIGWYTKEDLDQLPLQNDVKAYAIEALEMLS